MCTFYRGTIESILTSCITVWYGACNASCRKSLQRIVRAAEKIVGVSLPSIQDIYSTRLTRKALCITSDPTHPTHSFFGIPDLTVSGALSPCFVLFVFSSFYLFPVFCLSSHHARRSREISATGSGYPKPAGWISSSRVAAPPGPPFTGDHATGLPLTQAHRIAADSSPPDCR